MSRNTSRTRRIFGGAEAQLSGRYERPLDNPGNQAQAEALAVGTHRRVLKGPTAMGSGPFFSYHISPVTAAGATSALNIYYSNLPDPDPTNADHWVASGITAIDLTATTDIFGTVVDKCPTWIKFEAVVANSSGTLWAYVRTSGIEE